MNTLIKIVGKFLAIAFCICLIVFNTFDSNAQCHPSVTVTVTTQNLRCNGDNSGMISVSIVGGVPSTGNNYNYSLFSGIISPIIVNNYPLNNYSFTNLPAFANYLLVVQVPLAGGGFTVCPTAISLTEPPALSISLNAQNNVSCAGGNDGFIDANVSGGPTMPYTYLWSNGATTEDISGLIAGDYTLTITDGNNCSLSETFTVTEPTAIIATATPTQITCNTANDGAVNLTITGGTAPYGSFSWNNGATTQNISGLAPGTYSVTFKDAEGCTGTASTTINPAPSVITATAAPTQITCNTANDGAIDLTITGGTAPYGSYLWSNGATTQNISGLAPGTYSVTFKDAKGCTGTASATINPAPNAVTATAVPTQITCNAANDGTITLTPAGGTAPYGSYLWNNGATTQNISGLAPGTYSVTFKDAKGCTGTASATINPAPNAVTATAAPTQITCNTANDGAINLTITGGTAPYGSYLWSNGATTQDISGLAPGTYSVTFKDAKGCTGTASATINPAPNAVTATAVPTQITCNAANDGIITLTPVGGTTPYGSYLWSNGATTQNISGLAPGTYSVAFKDAKGCTGTASATINPAPTAVTATAVPTQITCNAANDGTITLTPAGGTAPYGSYLWNNGATTQNISGLAPGTYSVTFKDAKGCTGTASATITPAPNAVTATAVPTQITCNTANDGAINLTITGGTTPYGSYLWNNGATTQNISGLAPGTYSATFKDAKGCTGTASATITPAPTAVTATAVPTQITCNGANDGSIVLTPAGGTAPYGSYLWNNGATTQNISGLAPGTYSVSFKDAKGCTGTASATINAAPNAVSGTAINNNATCNGQTNGSLILTPAGGTPNYTYNWSNGTTNKDLTNVGPGTYTVTITDSKGCSNATPISFTINPTLTVTGTATASPSLICSGQGTTITASINSPFTPAANAYSFDGGLTFQASPSFPIAHITGDTTINVIVKDINGCISNTIAVAVTTTKITGVSVTQTKPVLCNGGNTAELTVTGGSSSYTYSLNGGAFQNTPVFSNLTAGNYTIIVNNGTGCNVSYNATITEPAPLTLAFKSKTDVNPCAGGNNGSISVTANGGIKDYTFKITPSGLTQTDSTFNNLTAGNYTIDVTDINGCTQTLNVPPITAPAPLDTAAIVAVIVDNTCAKEIKGSIRLTFVPGGISSYTYTLNNVTNATSVFTDLLAGDYTMIITDANNCSTNYNFKISAPDLLGYTPVKQPSSCNTPDGSINFTNVTGGTAPYKYSINKGLTYFTNPLFTGLSAGIYQLEVIDVNNCGASSIDTLPIKPAPVPYIRISEPLCHGADNGFIVIDSISGGIPPFQFRINDTLVGSSTVYANKKAGTYTLTIIDQACTYSIDSFYVYNKTTLVYDTISAPVITVGEPSTISASVFSENADRYESSGIAGVYNITGGTPGYLWSSDNTLFEPVTKDTILLNGLPKGNHTIFVVDTNGCTGSFDITIYVEFFIPNLITPNKDGKNDRFEIMALPRGSELLIVNRWGNRVYLSNNYDNSWDADEDSDGVYYYELTLPNGDKHKGWVEVTR